MGFLTKEQIGYIVDGSIFKCDAHGFACDRADIESIKKHFEGEVHYETGYAPCRGCDKQVEFKSIKKNAEGVAPNCFCDDCKQQIAKDLGIVGGKA